MTARRLLLAWQLVAAVAAVSLTVAGRPWWALAQLFPAHMAILWAVLVPGNRWLGPVVRKLPGSGSRREVWLTIDDGPCPRETPEILDLLDRAGAKATFFMVGKRAAAHPGLVAEVVRRGHAVGNHTWSHPAGTFWCASRRRLRSEIAEGQRVLAQLAGSPPRFFRAPVGMKPPGLHPELGRQGLRLVGWSARGFDGVSRDVPGVVGRLVRGLEPGAVLVVHEGHGHGPEVLAGLLRELAARGYRCVRPDMATAAPGGEPLHGSGQSAEGLSNTAR
jgi:peptidoglycan/xylan/chitin deacetylase (PgdA/CDA1 family)